MRRTVVYHTLFSLLMALSLGCSNRFRRPERYDPFASSRRGPEGQGASAADYPKLVQPRSNDSVTQAGQEFRPPPIAPDRQRSASEGRWTGDDDQQQDNHKPPSGAAIRPVSESALDHAPDYSWVQGRLEFSALGGGIWKVRYAPISADDEHGGSVILEAAPDPQKFRVGDLIYVEGRIVSRNAHGPLANPLYRAEYIQAAQETRNR